MVQGVDALQELMILVNRERAYMGDDPVTPQEVLNMVSDNPDRLQSVLDYAKEIEPNSSVGEDMGTNFVSKLSRQWTKIDTQLSNKDFKAIRGYFQNEHGVSELTWDQQQLLESMHFEDTDFVAGGGWEVDFGSERDAVNMYNLREQLVAKLKSTGVLTEDVLTEIQKVDSFQEHYIETDFIPEVGLELVPIVSEGCQDV